MTERSKLLKFPHAYNNTSGFQVQPSTGIFNPDTVAVAQPGLHDPAGPLQAVSLVETVITPLGRMSTRLLADGLHTHQSITSGLRGRQRFYVQRCFGSLTTPLCRPTRKQDQSHCTCATEQSDTHQNNLHSTRRDVLALSLLALQIGSLTNVPAAQALG